MGQAASHPGVPLLSLQLDAIATEWCHGTHTLTPTGSVFYLFLCMRVNAIS